MKLGAKDLRWNRGLASSEFAEKSDANAVALSAFYLSFLPNEAARKEVINQVWNSGADVMVSRNPCSRIDRVADQSVRSLSTTTRQQDFPV